MSDEQSRQAVLDAIRTYTDSASEVTSGTSVAHVVEAWVGVHPGGATIVMVMQSDSDQLAGAAVEHLVRHILATEPLLAGWRLSGCTCETLS